MRVVWGKDMRECATDVVMAELVVVVAVVVVVADEAYALAALGAIGLRVLALLIPPPACTDYNRGD
jgi:hypothetical protein